jgi:hypothetical protein
VLRIHGILPSIVQRPSEDTAHGIRGIRAGITPKARVPERIPAEKAAKIASPGTFVAGIRAFPLKIHGNIAKICAQKILKAVQKYLKAAQKFLEVVQNYLEAVQTSLGACGGGIRRPYRAEPEGKYRPYHIIAVKFRILPGRSGIRIW